MPARATIVILLFSLSMTTIIFSLTAVPGTAVITQPQSGQTPFFSDNFNGSSIDHTKWNSTFATSGLRWCSSTVANHEDAPGLWLNPSTSPCQNGSQSPPFGSVSVGGGTATFSSFASETFPYIWTGLPSKPSPFPASGNFILEVKMRYNTITGSGDGFFVNKWNNSDPVGNNPPGGQPRIFLIWADGYGLRVQLLGNLTYNVYNELGTHDYVLAYLDGRYSVFVDGFQVLGPIASNARANAMWIGNPVFTWWLSSHDWSSFSLNQVQVTIPRIQVNPASGPTGTKVLVQGTGIPVPFIEITFDDMFIGTTPVTDSSFSFTLDVPTAQPGIHQIKAVGEFSNVITTAQFVVTQTIQSGLAVTLTVGTVYFPGDTAVANLLVTSAGAPVSSLGLRIQVNLTKPDSSKIVLNTTSHGNGLSRASFLLPRTAQIGTYSLLAVVQAPSMGNGSAIATFEVKLPWLSSQGSTLTVVGLASTAAAGVALVSWRKGYFRRSKDGT